MLSQGQVPRCGGKGPAILRDLEVVEQGLCSNLGSCETGREHQAVWLKAAVCPGIGSDSAALYAQVLCPPGGEYDPDAIA